MSERIKMSVTMDVTIPQALALKAMFEYWNVLSSRGGSRKVGFYVDGDGDFHPKVAVAFAQPLPELTPEMKQSAIVEDNDGNCTYDYDSIAWMLHNKERGK